MKGHLQEMRFRHQLIPDSYSQADAEWIGLQLQLLTPAARQKAMLRYAEVYQETYDAEPVSFKKENRARHEANTRLRQFVRTLARPLQGYTDLPPLVGKS